jgi:hypothetical protein
MEMGSQLHAPAALPPGKECGIYSIGGWVGPRAGLDVSGKDKIRVPYRYSNSRPSGPQSGRYGLSYSGSFVWFQI